MAAAFSDERIDAGRMRPLLAFNWGDPPAVETAQLIFFFDRFSHPLPHEHPFALGAFHDGLLAGHAAT